MIASSRKVKLAAAVLAITAHGGALLAVMPPMEQAEMEGMSGGSDLALGTDFADMAVGTISADPVEDTAETVQPDQPEQVQPETVQPAQTVAPQPVTPTEAEPIDQQVAALPVVPPLEAEAVLPVVPMEPTEPEEQPEVLEAQPPQTVESAEPEVAEPVQPEPETLTAEAPEQEPLEAEEQEPEEVTETAPEQSQRPKLRDPEIAKRPPEPAPAPQPQREPEPTPEPRQQAARPQGNAEQNATAGAATGRAGGSSATSGSGGQAREAGNAAASNYPGQVMRKLSRVPRPRVNARGAAVIAFRVSGSGGLAGVSVARSSGSAALDQAALRVVRSASPFPAPPSGAQTSFTVQIKGR
ncbi:energy transducer TonB family protein [Alloyangia pacifica]|uniref:Outer membrane transport energization protein TonB (TC 2.C.1.1.1) n=1 Tax=Alloyangia pacifica TaxID=311180 RepID=A0A1I6RNC1_9RHOB|nr:energy transducer TonB [Alloyangia pacifica]SDG54119.1 outer membrane transport energization protein TonB [Alloyangia pacifica]SFS66217.1 outer membrane transport energization protein TonB (TC 2.C.1.1.1) [Alloyangia pacifica]